MICCVLILCTNKTVCVRFDNYNQSKHAGSEPLMHYRYMDDTFVVFDNKRECDFFLEQLNSLHPSLRFTFENECNQSLPFFDVMVKTPVKIRDKILPGH